MRAHLAGRDDGLATVAPVLDRVGDFAAFLAEAVDPVLEDRLRASAITGRPAGNAEFIAGLERVLGRPVARRAPGRKPSPQPHDQPALP